MGESVIIILIIYVQKQCWHHFILHTKCESFWRLFLLVSTTKVLPNSYSYKMNLLELSPVKKALKLFSFFCMTLAIDKMEYCINHSFYSRTHCTLATRQSASVN